MRIDVWVEEGQRGVEVAKRILQPPQLCVQMRDLAGDLGPLSNQTGDEVALSHAAMVECPAASAYLAEVSLLHNAANFASLGPFFLRRLFTWPIRYPTA
jgi:hypothetical protein